MSPDLRQRDKKRADTAAGATVHELDEYELLAISTIARLVKEDGEGAKPIDAAIALLAASMRERVDEAEAMRECEAERDEAIKARDAARAGAWSRARRTPDPVGQLNRLVEDGRLLVHARGGLAEAEQSTDEQLTEQLVEALRKASEISIERDKLRAARPE